MVYESLAAQVVGRKARQDHGDEETAQSGSDCAQADRLPTGCWPWARTPRRCAGKLGVSEATYHRWRTQFGGLKDLERENATLKVTLKRLLADAELEKGALRVIAKGKLLGPERRRAAVRHLQRVLGSASGSLRKPGQSFNPQ